MLILPDTVTLFGSSIPYLALQIPIGTALALLVGIASLRARFITPGGVALMTLIGFTTFGLGGPAWAFPIFAFFLPSSLITRMGKNRKKNLTQLHQKGGRRDAGQVLANGGVAGLLALIYFIYPHPGFYTAYLASLGAAAADTWSAETGVLGPERPRLITTWRVVEPGVSGGITLLGSIGGMVGASIVYGSAMPFVPFLWDGGLFGLVLLCALAGNIADSLLGATLQEKRLCVVCAHITERKQHCEQPTQLSGGLGGFDNDIVNLLCTAVGAALGFWLVTG